MSLHNPHNTEMDFTGRVFLSPQMQDRTDEAVEWLKTSPSLMGELVLNDEELVSLSAAMKSSNGGEFLRVYRLAMDRHVAEALDSMKDRSGTDSDYEAALSLRRVHS